MCLKWILDLIAFLIDFILYWFAPPPTASKSLKLPKSVAVAGADVSGVVNFFKNFSEIKTIQVFSPEEAKVSSDQVDLLVIHDPTAYPNFLSVPDYVPREILSYAELIPVTSLSEKELMGALFSFSSKSQRFGR